MVLAQRAAPKALEAFSLASVFTAALAEMQALARLLVALLEPAVTLVQRLALLATSSPTFMASSLVTARPHWRALCLQAPRADSRASSRVVPLVAFSLASREASAAATRLLSKASLMPTALEMERLMLMPLLPLVVTDQRLEAQVLALISLPASALTSVQS